MYILRGLDLRMVWWPPRQVGEVAIPIHPFVLESRGWSVSRRSVPEGGGPQQVGGMAVVLNIVGGHGWVGDPVVDNCVHRHRYGVPGQDLRETQSAVSGSYTVQNFSNVMKYRIVVLYCSTEL